VRADRQAIFDKFYSSTNVRLDNVSIEIDSAGREARITYDNSYNWRGGSKYLTGKSRNAMILFLSRALVRGRGAVAGS
jgi:hypothetical protein